MLPSSINQNNNTFVGGCEVQVKSCRLSSKNVVQDRSSIHSSPFHCLFSSCNNRTKSVKEKIWTVDFFLFQQNKINSPSVSSHTNSTTQPHEKSHVEHLNKCPCKHLPNHSTGYVLAPNMENAYKGYQREIILHISCNLSPSSKAWLSKLERCGLCGGIWALRYFPW